MRDLADAVFWQVFWPVFPFALGVFAVIVAGTIVAKRLRRRRKP